MTDKIQDGKEKLLTSTIGSVHQNYVIDADCKRTFKEAYYQWVSRLMLLLCILSMGFLASASLCLFKMAPQVRVEPFLIIKQDNSDEMVRYEVLARDMASRDQLMEMFIRQYVMLRNNILQDTTEMQSRWLAGGIVNYLSAPKVYIQFNKETVKGMDKILSSGVVQDTEVISVNRVGGKKSPVWKVDFRTYEMKRASGESEDKRFILKTKYWAATLTAFFLPQRLFMARRLINPLGFTVTRYSQTEVEIL